MSADVCQVTGSEVIDLLVALLFAGVCGWSLRGLKPNPRSITIVPGDRETSITITTERKPGT